MKNAEIDVSYMGEFLSRRYSLGFTGAGAARISDFDGHEGVLLYTSRGSFKIVSETLISAMALAKHLNRTAATRS